MSQPLKFVNHRIDEYALQVTYNPSEETGEVIYNLSLIRTDDLENAIEILKNAYQTGLSVSDKVLFSNPGERFGDYTIPEEHTGICTMCSITLDALLIQRGVPLNPIGGGLVEIEKRVPRRFITMIQYEHTTIDPTQVLISQGTSRIMDVMTEGNGLILGNMRECHMEAESLIFDVLEELAGAGFTGILDVGVPNTSLLGVPVTPNYQGISMVGGTNPIAAFKETGRWAEVKAMKGLIEVSRMDSIENF
jgi:repressor of nif and glnA expression